MEVMTPPPPGVSRKRGVVTRDYIFMYHLGSRALVPADCAIIDKFTG